MATIKDVAEHAGVSISTVSRVLNRSARVAQDKYDAVEKALIALNFQPNAAARALVGHRTGILGLLVNSFADPFFGAFMCGVQREATVNGMQVIAAEGYHHRDREERALRSLLARRCDALIIHALALPDQTLVELIGDLPAIVVNRHIPAIADRCLWFDNFQAGYMATQHLLSKGHINIGWIGRDEDIADNRDRFAGFLQAMGESHGFTSGDLATACAEGSAAGGYRAAQQLLAKHPELSAILTYSDIMAGGCLRALNERNVRLPEQFSVMGIDDVYLGEYLYPQLTTIRYPIETIGQTAVRMAQAILQKQTVAIDHCFQPTLVERASVCHFTANL